MIYLYLNALFIFFLISFDHSLLAQYVDQEVMKVRTESFLNIKRMITGRKRVSLDTSDIRLPLKRGADMEACYTAFLEKEKNDIYKKFESKFDIHLAEINKRRKIEADTKNDIIKPTNCVYLTRQKTRDLRLRKPSETILKRARATIALFHANPEDVPIIEESDSDDSPAGANDSIIILYEKEMKKYDEDIQAFLVAHEFVHFIEKHVTEEYVLRKLLKEKYKKLTSSMIQLLCEHSRCDEIIADVKGVLRGGKPLVDGYKKFAEKFISEKPCNTHLANRDRFTEAELLSKELVLISEHRTLCSN